jgi:hypothetical protein
LAVEININPKERLKQKTLYSNKLDNGQKALIVRWQQNVVFICLFYLMKISNFLIKYLG